MPLINKRQKHEDCKDIKIEQYQHFRYMQEKKKRDKVEKRDYRM